MQTVRAIPDETKGVDDKDDRAEILKHALRSENERRIAAMIKLAEKLPAFAVLSDAFDRDPFLLNTPSGTVNLQTGGLHPHDRTDLITKLTGAPYVPGARSEKWDRFLIAVTEGIDVADGERAPSPDERAEAAEMRAFLQRLAGYSATGVAIEEVAPMIHGPERSGKSTLAAAVHKALGDYSKTADFETFLKRREAGGIRTDLRRLNGARMVASIEVEDGKDLAAALFKRITGGDEQLARGLYASEIVLKPTATFWLVVNHAPRVDATDGAMWRRILRIPFPHTVPAAKRDTGLKARLTDPSGAGPAVLAWVVEGCLAWRRGGLSVPERVTRATEALRADMDPLGDFFDDCCTFAADATERIDHMHQSYLGWCRANGIKFPLKRKDFGQHLEQRGCERAKGTGGARVWRGVRLNHARLYDMNANGAGDGQANVFASAWPMYGGDA